MTHCVIKLPVTIVLIQMLHVLESLSGLYSFNTRRYFLVAVLCYDNKTHFWRIPSSELEKLDYFGLGGNVTKNKLKARIGTRHIWRIARRCRANTLGGAAACNTPNMWPADNRLLLVLGHVAWSEVQRVDRVDGVLLPSLRLPHSRCSPSHFSLSSRIAEGDFAPLISSELFRETRIIYI